MKSNITMGYWKSVLLVLLSMAMPCCLAAPSNSGSPSGPALQIEAAVQAALNAGATAAISRLDLGIEVLQARLAPREFTPQGTLTLQAERARSPDTGKQTTRAAALESSLKLRTGATVSASVNRSVANSPDNTLGVPAGTQIETRTVKVAQPLLRGAGVEVATANERLAALRLSSAKQRFVQAMNELVTNAVLAYFSVDQAAQNVALMRSAVERAEQLRKSRKALFAAGRIARADLLQNDTDLATAELALAQALNEEKLAKRELLRLMGSGAADPEIDAVKPVDPFLRYVDATVPAEQAAVELALVRRPDLQQARDAVASAQVALLMARNDTRHQLDVYARVDNQSAVGRGAQISGGWGVQLTIPLDNSTARTAAGTAQSRLEQAQLAQQEAERNARAEVRNAIQALRYGTEQQRLTERSEVLSRQRMDNEATKARMGRSSAIDLSLAQEALRQASAQRLHAQFSVFSAQLNLQKASGTILDRWDTAGMVNAMLASASARR